MKCKLCKETMIKDNWSSEYYCDNCRRNGTPGQKFSRLVQQKVKEE